MIKAVSIVYNYLLYDETWTTPNSNACIFVQVRIQFETSTNLVMKFDSRRGALGFRAAGLLAG
jgi:hypothetical protein